MHKASNALTVLQAIAAIAGFAIVLWSIGFPAIRFAEAANVTNFSDTLSDSAPSVVSDHTVQFTIPTGSAGVTAGQTMTITFPAGFNLGSVAFGDMDLLINGSQQTLAAAASGATWGATKSGQVVTITSGTGTVTAGQVVTIRIGTNATQGGTGVNQITNPSVGSYEISVTAGASDTGKTRVAIVDNVTVSASVDTLFTFTVAGTAKNTTVNTADTTGASTTATTIPFGKLLAGVASTAAQRLTVVTNARSGFVVTVTADSQLVSSNGADIDGFANGAYTSTPTAWSSPTGTPGSENTYGHWGVTTDDDTLTSSPSNPYNVSAGGNRFVSASTTPVEVFRNYGPSNGATQGQGTTLVGYKVERSALQEAADDYTAVLTYVATPVF